MSACAQLIIAFLLILLQLGIIIALFVMEPPEVYSMHVCLTVIDKMTLLTLLPLPFLPHVPLHTLVCFFFIFKYTIFFRFYCYLSVSKLSECDTLKPISCLRECSAILFNILRYSLSNLPFSLFHCKANKSCLHFKSIHPSMLYCSSRNEIAEGLSRRGTSWTSR